MLPGPIYVYECPQCGHYFAQGSIASGNTFGSTLYSDGKRISPMLPGFPELIKCESCHKIFKISDAREIGSYDFWEQPEERFKYVQGAPKLQIADYFEAIRQGIPRDENEERWIRERIWRAYNDRIRKDQPIFNDEQDELLWKENLLRLLSLVQRLAPDNRVMIAEMHRNLGDFKTCLDIIQHIDDPKLNWLKDSFIRECEVKNRWVVELR